MFKFWSDIKKEAKDELRPDLGFRSWDDLGSEDKRKIWSYLWEVWFFDSNQNSIDAFYSDKRFSNEQDRDKDEKLKRIVAVLDILNHKYKAKTYARKFLDKRSISTALEDFYNIYIEESENAVFELLSIYAKKLIIDREDVLSQKEGESEEDFKKRNEKYIWEEFDNFSENLNDLFDHFGIYIFLTKQGFVPKQDEKIAEEIYKPVLSYLSDQKWGKVSEILSDAFSDYRKNTPQGYSGCVTKTISAIEAFLQILIEGKTGGMKLSPLISKGQKENFIPNDIFSQIIFKNIDSIFARERKSTGDAHPKDEYATEKNARTILNLAMVFIQHCIIK